MHLISFATQRWIESCFVKHVHKYEKIAIIWRGATHVITPFSDHKEHVKS